VTSNPIIAGLRQEIDTLSDDDYIADACTYCHVFLDYIQSRRKLVQGLGNDGQEWSIEVEQDHMVMFRDIKDKEVMAVVAAWWCYREETQERVVE